jgi:hypothetical protein
MKKPLRVLSSALGLLALLVACGKSGKDGAAPAAGSTAGKAAVSKAADDIPSSNRTGMYVDRFRFGDATDADGVVIKETSLLSPGAPPAMSLYIRNAPSGTQMRVVWNDLAKNAALGEEVKAVGDKGFVAFKKASPLPEGSYRATMSYKQSAAKTWENLGSHDFKVGNKS